MLSVILQSLFFLFFITQSDLQDFDCPMRALAVEYATYINPYITRTQLQQICDAINGSPEAQNCSIKPPVNHSPAHHHHTLNTINDDIATIYVDIEHGNDTNSANISINNPLKTIEAAIAFARKHYGSSILKRIIVRKGTYYLPSTIKITPRDSNLIISNYMNETVNITGALPLQHLEWKIHKKMHNLTIYKTKLNRAIASITGLRVNGYRAILARYPNANPETDGFGSNQFPHKWMMATNHEPDYEYINTLPELQRNDTNPPINTHYRLFIGGEWLSRMTPAASFFSGSTPIGLQYNATVLPHAPYNDVSQLIIAGWQMHHWQSWFWKINSTATQLQDIEDNHKSDKWIFGVGGNQGARAGAGAEFYVMNVIQELDQVNEFFYNNTESVLYYIPNATDFESFEYEATHLKTLIAIEGNQTHSVRNVVITGLHLIDSAFTGLEAHGVPSGGDWALQYSAALEIIGAQNITISHNLFSRCDGNAVLVFNYNRNISITHNEFVWIGDSSVVSWGSTQGIDFPELDAQNVRYSTMGIDGTNGNQPRFLNVSYNIAHELGIFQKQSSFYFQSKSCQNDVSHNIFYNGPRAGIVFNDGFGGSSVVERNLMFNTCRESSDHGPFNSWDRQPYLTKVGLFAPKAHITKEYDDCRYNFLISNYGADDPLDNDDTSQYYRHYNNLLVYGVKPFKSNYGGHNIHHRNNIYAYSETCGVLFNTQPLSETADIWENCTCVLTGSASMNSTTDYMKISKGCNGANSTIYPQWNHGFVSKNNIIRQKNGNMYNLGLCGVSQINFTATTANGRGTIIKDLPNTKDLLTEARILLWT